MEVIVSCCQTIESSKRLIEKEGKKLSDWQLKYLNAETDEDLYKAEIDEDLLVKANN